MLYKIFSLLPFLLLTTFFTIQPEPFSLKEIESIPDFALQQPQFLKTTDTVELAYYNFSKEPLLSRRF